jgi:hypothetical protein
VGSSTPGGALRYEDQRNKNPHVFDLSGPLARFVQRVVYKHCVRPGQVKCGQIAALPARQIFKQAFEIESTGKTAIVYQS